MQFGGAQIEKGSMHLQVFFLSFFVLLSTGYCAQKDVVDACLQRQCECDAILPGSNLHFGVNDDKMGHAFAARTKYCDPGHKALMHYIDQRESVSFDDFEQQARQYSGDIWGRIFYVMSQRKNLYADFEKKSFVWREQEVEPPEERIEIFMAALFEEDPTCSRRNLVLMLYNSGYRDYHWKAIAGKERALLSAGFIDVQQRGFGANQAFFDRMEGYWEQVFSQRTDLLAETYFDAGSDNKETLYQMIYIKTHKIGTQLKRHAQRNDGSVFGFALERQKGILDHLQKSDANLWTVSDIEELCVDISGPQGVRYEMANLVFLGKVLIYRGEQHGQYTFALNKGEPWQKASNDGGGDEMAFFENIYKCARVDDAILETYYQGYRAFSPRKLLLYKKAFQLMSLAFPLQKEAPTDLSEFLQRHACIPPIWLWGDAWYQAGWHVLSGRQQKILDCVFEMHNRGALLTIKHAAAGLHRSGSALFENCKLQVQQCFQGEGSRSLKDFLKVLRKVAKEHKATVYNVMDVVKEFNQCLDYHEKEDQFVWLETPKEETVWQEEDGEAACCFLRNHYPGITLDKMCLLLSYMGIPINPHKAKVMFYALEIADMLPPLRPKKSECIGRCQPFFAIEKNSPNWVRDHPNAVLAGKTLDARGRQIVQCAVRIFGNQELQDIAINSRRKDCIFSTCVEKTTKVVAKKPSSLCRVNPSPDCDETENGVSLEEEKVEKLCSQSMEDGDTFEGPSGGLLDILCQAVESVEGTTLEEKCRETKALTQTVRKRPRLPEEGGVMTKYRKGEL